ncbi:hypothetical protein EJ02DRAFT_516167, partial [Clathrospora elynae]
MPSTSDDSPVNRLIASLHPQRIAVQAGTTEAVARDVVFVLMHHVDQHVRARPAPGRQDRFKITSEALLAVVRDTDTNKLAVENRAPEEDVHRILRVVTAVADATSAQVQQEAAQPWERQEFFAPEQIYGENQDLEWPESIPEHAYRLLLAFERVHHPDEPLGRGTVVMSPQDLRSLQNGMMALQRKITHAYGNIIDGIAPQQRPEFATESWYTSRRGHQQATAKTEEMSSTADIAARALVKMHRASAEAPPNEMVVHAYTQAGSMPYPKVRDHLAHPQFPASAQKGLPLSSSQVINSQISGVVPYSGFSLERACSAMQPLVPKHDLPRSPGNSPVKKKTRDGTAAASIHREKEKKNDVAYRNGAYRLFLLAERKRVGEELAEHVSGLQGGVKGKELSSLMVEIWSHMPADDKAPFVATYDAEQEQENKNTGALVAPDRQRGNNQTFQDMDRIKRVESIERCNTVLNARTICQFMRLRTQTPANSVTRAAAAAARRYHSAAPDLPQNEQLYAHPTPAPSRGSTDPPANSVTKAATARRSSVTPALPSNVSVYVDPPLALSKGPMALSPRITARTSGRPPLSSAHCVGNRTPQQLLP